MYFLKAQYSVSVLKVLLDPYQSLVIIASFPSVCRLFSFTFSVLFLTRNGALFYSFDRRFIFSCPRVVRHVFVCIYRDRCCL